MCNIRYLSEKWIFSLVVLCFLRPFAANVRTSLSALMTMGQVSVMFVPGHLYGTDPEPPNPPYAGGVNCIPYHSCLKDMDGVIDVLTSSSGGRVRILILRRLRSPRVPGWVINPHSIPPVMRYGAQYSPRKGRGRPVISSGIRRSSLTGME